MGSEKRVHQRMMQRYPVRLHLDDPEADPRVVRGILEDLSLGGAQVRTESFVGRGETCVLELVGAAGRVRPHQQHGTVRAAGPATGNRFSVRVQFDKPLKEIKEPGKL